MMPRRIHAFSSDDALGEYDAVGLVEALHAGRLSVPEVVEAAIARAEQVRPTLNTIAFEAFGAARDEARDPRPGYFAGVPTWLKDNVEVAGMPTMQGTDAWSATVERADGDFARMYLATGLLPLGKSRLCEFGFLPSTEHPRLGPVRCPWDTRRTAGASSSGAAAMVAAGVVPIAHANDGGGSIRIPASVNGLVGLKPTRGRLAQDTALRQMPVQIVSDGVVTRSVRDTAAFLREAERVYRPLRLPPVGDLSRPGRARLRIAVHTDSVGRVASDEVRELTLGVAARLEELGHHVEPLRTVPVAETFADDFVLYWAFLGLVLVATGRRAHGPSWDPTRLDAFTHGLARHARRNRHRLPAAIWRLRRAARLTETAYRRYDVLLTPTLAMATPMIGHLDPGQDYDVLIEKVKDWVAFTPVHNVTGEPAISLPVATTSDGLPQGMMFGAAAGREATLIELAYELEGAIGFARVQDTSDT